MAIIFPDNTGDVIDQIREAIGRDVIFYIQTGTIPCSGCRLDPITDTSVNSFCPICSGLYWIPVISGCSVLAHITWGNADNLGWVPGGQLFDGDCRLQIKNTITNLDVVDKMKYVNVDGKILTLKNTILRGVKKLNRIILNLIESEKEA